VVSGQSWFRGPDADTDGDVYRALILACYAVHPVIRGYGGHWVMNLDWYKRVRAEAGMPGDDDPEKWEPKPDDMLLGLPVTVTDDGGAPHVENRNYPPDFDAVGLPDHGRPRRPVRRRAAHGPGLGCR
jgi:hypothetical protein